MATRGAIKISGRVEKRRRMYNCGRKLLHDLDDDNDDDDDSRIKELKYAQWRK